MDAQTEYPPFQLNRPRFNQGTFYGRLRHFLDVIDPRTLLTSSKQLDDAIKLLDEYKSGNVPDGITNKQLWEAQKIKQAIIHPDTGEKVFMPFRMSGFVPFGSFIVVGMLLPNQSFKQVIFWQWLNQSHNACVNFANRNASKPTPLKRFVLGYVGAVTTAVSIAVGLNLLIKRSSTFSATTKMLIQRLVPFPATATASTCNVLLMRNSELWEGIEVVDKDGSTVGTSQVAAKKALKETAITRMFLPAPILLIPPLVMSVLENVYDSKAPDDLMKPGALWETAVSRATLVAPLFLIPPLTMAMLEKRKFLIRNPRLHLPINAVVCTLAFGLALPVAIALFPQMSEIHREQLEPDLQAASRESVLYYNKGL